MEPAYVAQVADLLGNPAFHIAAVWGIYMATYQQWLGARVRRIEKYLDIMPPPPVRPFARRPSK